MSEDGWVPANIARDRLEKTTGKGLEILIVWASNGELRSRAATWNRGWREPKLDADLPTEFWLGTPVSKDGTALDCISSTDWDSGIFSMMVNETGLTRYVEDPPPYQHTAHFVEFSAEDLTRCIANLKIKQRQGLQDKKPPLAQAKLENWFQDLGSDVERMSQTKILQLCREAHPTNSITRARIRAITPDRDRGPKPKPH